MATTKIATRKIRGLAALFTGAAALFAAIIAPLAAPAQTASAPSPNILEQMGDALTALVRKAQPCVVTIQPRPTALSVPHLAPRLTPQQRSALSPEKQKEYDAAQERSWQEMNDFIFAALEARRPPFKGSGFVMRGGFVVTTAEVVERIKDPMVIFADGSRLGINWLDIDALSNIAVMNISLPSDIGLDWADPDTVEPGGIAITIGSQGDYPRSVSLGIISGVGRVGRSGPLRYENLIQFQGAVGAGGSGGPLLNARGELIGMVVAAPADIFASGPRSRPENREQGGGRRNEHSASPPPQTTPFSGLSNTGFALASRDIRPITDILRRNGTRPPSGYIGVFLSSDMESASTQILNVLPNSPAAKAGVLKEDIITAINGQSFRTLAELRAYAGRIAAGDELQITIRRGPETKTVRLTALPRLNQ